MGPKSERSSPPHQASRLGDYYDDYSGDYYDDYSGDYYNDDYFGDNCDDYFGDNCDDYSGDYYDDYFDNNINVIYLINYLTNKAIMNRSSLYN